MTQREDVKKKEKPIVSHSPTHNSTDEHRVVYQTSSSCHSDKLEAATSVRGDRTQYRAGKQQARSRLIIVAW